MRTCPADPTLVQGRLEGEKGELGDRESVGKETFTRAFSNCSKAISCILCASRSFSIHSRS